MKRGGALTAEERDTALRVHGSMWRYCLFCLRNRVQTWLYWRLTWLFRWRGLADKSLTELDDRLYALEQRVEAVAEFGASGLRKLGAEWEADVILVMAGLYDRVPKDRQAMYEETGRQVQEREAAAKRGDES